ncbi:BolA family protein [Rhodovulum adriaticum]|uniref:BolA protein n=1 Tax=Rhodovulum adriaticum TaxID=35804 RepID=A0A4R2NW54_RHOAD|nr:BolA family protein [Rhodovulum adriaticum]MBK1636279.1 BolA family transcriptional regulator [Rhodovulum adriaticum]TCP26280.1 BolA protein [Rhodovulum adriaticum]
MKLSDEIHSRLLQAFAPTRLEVIDDSERHRGHSGWREGGQTHFKVQISAPAFAEMAPLARHRAVHDALGKEVLNRIHALSLTVEG